MQDSRWQRQRRGLDCALSPDLCLSKSICLGLVMSPGLTPFAEPISRPNVSHLTGLALHPGVLLISPLICAESLFSFELLPPAGLTSCPEFWSFGWGSVTWSNSYQSIAALKCQSTYLLPSILFFSVNHPTHSSFVE